MKVFVTGATGYVGRAVAAALVARGDEVRGLTRGGAGAAASVHGGGAGLPKGVQRVEGDCMLRGPWSTAVSGCDAVVHLAGETIGGRRWSRAQKALIRESRVAGTRNVVAAIETSPADLRPRVLACASGVDYYPFDESERAYAEDAAPGDTFLAGVCTAWEAEAAAARRLGTRVVSVRSGVVLGRDAEALEKMAQPFRLFAGGPIGSGRQWFSWVHLADVVGAYLHALDTAALAGAVNAVSPGAVRARDLARALGRALRRPSWAPVPGLALRAVAGGIATYLLSGRRAVPGALEQSGYRFRAPEIGAALAASL